MSDLSKNPLLKTDSYINGQWVKGTERFDVFNPANKETVTDVADLGQAETKEAINAANDAWPAWKKLTADERSAYLRKWYELQMKHLDDIAEIMTTEQGKSLTESKGEIKYGAAFTEFYAEEAKRAYGEIIPSQNADSRIVVTKEPVGVVGAITPWNFPFAMITRKIAPALAAGCTVVVKPAEDTPLTALALAYLAEQAGIPKGVVNIITSSEGAKVGAELTENPLVRKISFTGSTEVGRLLMKQSADTVKKISLELGGNASFIVFDDADIEMAVKGLIGGKFRNTGQACVSPNRIFVQSGIYDAFAEEFTKAVKDLKVGNGFEEGVEIGPLINDNAIEKVATHVSNAVNNGATVMTGGQPSSKGALFFEPTVLKDATKDMVLFEEETFGPVAPLFKFSDEAEVINLANETHYGLANYFYTRDIGRVWRVAEGLESGIVSVNETSFSSAKAPFGGYKQSGLGREGGHYGLEEFLETKYIYMAGISNHV